MIFLRNKFYKHRIEISAAFPYTRVHDIEFNYSESERICSICHQNQNIEILRIMDHTRKIKVISWYLISEGHVLGATQHSTSKNTIFRFHKQKVPLEGPISLILVSLVEIDQLTHLRKESCQ